jgi:ferritin-like protein
MPLALNTVATQPIERAGADVSKLVAPPVPDAAPELTTSSYCTTLRVNLNGSRGAGLKQSAEDVRVEDRDRFEALLSRIHEPDGELPDGMVDFQNISVCSSASPCPDWSNTYAMSPMRLAPVHRAVRGETLTGFQGTN